MAANAYSIAHVPTHQRGQAPKEVTTAEIKAERAEIEGRGCIVINGELIVFETGRYPAEGELIVVVFGDGRIEVARMPERRSHWRSDHSPHVLMVDVDRGWHRGMRAIREEATLIGAVRR